MKRTRTLALITGTALLLSFFGCGTTKVNTKDKTANTEAESETEVEVATKPVEASLSEAKAGEELEYEKISAVCDGAYLSDYTFVEENSGETMELVFFHLTITNNSDETISAGILSQCYSSQYNGTGYEGANMQSYRYAIQEFGEDAGYFEDSIKSGETASGYVGLEVPEGFENVSLVYFPTGFDADYTQGFQFTFDRDELEAAPEPAVAFS